MYMSKANLTIVVVVGVMGVASGKLLVVGNG